MRALFICVMAASLAGCGCYMSPGLQACTGFSGSFACYDRHADLRLTELSDPDSALSEQEPPAPEIKARHAARKVKLASADSSDAISHAAQEEKPAPTAANLGTPAWAQRFQGSDPVITKAKTAVAAKLENPASAVFDEMDRAVRKNTLGQSVDSICGRVKSKKTSGDQNETRSFLYLVKDEEAFVADDSSASASMAYHAICK